MNNKILVCNDNNKVLENTLSILEKNKYNYDLANSYAVLIEAIEKQSNKANHYPIIVTDLKVNKQTLDDYLVQIKKIAAKSTIIVTYSQTEKSLDWLDQLVKDNSNIIFLKKPFDTIELVQLIKNNIVKPSTESQSCNVELGVSNRKLLENISHEIRTPLASIVGLAEVLKGTKLNDEQARNVKAIFRCSDSLLNIITDMIDFDRLQNEDVILNHKDFSLIDLTEGIVTLVAEQAKHKEIDVNIAISDDTPNFIHSDESKIRQVIWHLLTNAVKYTNYGNVTLFTDYQKSSKGKNNLIITIKDTGMGIDEKSLKNLFAKYHNNSDDMYRSGGSGIGLSTTKKLIDAFGGDIQIKSTVDVGTTCVITLPVETVHDKTLQLQFGSFTPLNESHGIFVSLKEKTAEAIIAQFKKQNCILSSANSIRDARNIIQSSEANLKWCIVDDCMATTENIPLLKNLILSCKRNSIRVVITSKNEDAIQLMASIGVYNILEKPCLERKIRKLLSYHLDTSSKTIFSPSLLPLDNMVKSKGYKILIAEDNEINQLVLANLLKKQGHEIEIAKNGKIAVDRANINDYDLILMDLQMPIMDGIEATTAIRLKNDKTPIIAMTANISQHLQNECKIAGVNEFLTKPVTNDTLKSVITTHLG